MLEGPWRNPPSGQPQGMNEAKMTPEAFGPLAFDSVLLNPEGGLEGMSKTGF
jgi:hypothetical protein